MKLAEDAVIEIVGADHLSGYELKLYFSDGVERIILKSGGSTKLY
jgi:hypothetical protein